jgi:DNA-directed RNA polymerase subunit M
MREKKDFGMMTGNRRWDQERINHPTQTIVVPMFCPKCKSMLISSGGQMKCRKCGYIKSTKDENLLKRTRQASERTITIIEDPSISTLPTIATKCPKCEHNTAFWWLRQLRSADESEVRFFRCCKCGHTWREYD